jgi:hypothetical protein
MANGWSFLSTENQGLFATVSGVLPDLIEKLCRGLASQALHWWLAVACLSSEVSSL